MPSLRVHIAIALLTLTTASAAQWTHHASHAEPAPQATPKSWDFFTNFGAYMPRTHCVVNSEGRADWPWIIALVTLTAGVIIAYARIYYFWIKTHREQASRDRNKKMFELANIFFWCAVCGYGFSVLAFAWPAYRLLAIALFLLNIWSWKFILTDLGEFKQSLCAKVMERQFMERLALQNETLEREVAQRTSELQQALSRVEEACIAKGQFLATMSHEIRTPVTAILGYAEMLANDESARRSHEQIKAAADTIYSSSRHLLLIIDDILDVSKIEAGKMTIEQVEMGVVEMTEEIRRLLLPRAEQKRVELVVAYESPIPERIVSDPIRLRQILLNIIGNAIKFTEKGRVTVRIRFTPASGTLAFEVADTGIGMTPEQLRKVGRFEAFTQADGSTTRRFGGTGLGLKISHELARMLGAQLAIDSTIDVGTMIVLTLKAGAGEHTRLIPPEDIATDTQAPTREAPRSPAADPETALDNTRILLVEDGADNQILFNSVLKKQGADVVTTSNGREAIDLLDRLGHNAFDLVLMDMQMPILDGYQTAGLLRAQGFKAPIVAFTAHAMQGSRERCLKAGCDDFLTKPVTRADLIDMCRRWAVPNDRRRSA